MLVVKIEVWPGGNHDRAKEVARIGIANQSRLRPVSDYSAVMILGPFVDLYPETASGAMVRGHRRSSGWHPLVMSALENLYGSFSLDVPQAEEIVSSLVKGYRPAA